jgi:hypothetical protein
VEVLRSFKTHYFRFNRYSPLVAVLHGFPPNLEDPYGSFTVLDHVASAVRRLQFDVDSRVLTLPCSPTAFAAWCRTNRVELDEDFIAGLPIPVDNPTEPTEGVTRDGRASIAARDAEICRRVSEIAERMVRVGDEPKKDVVIEELRNESDVISHERLSKIISKARLPWSGWKTQAAVIRTRKGSI